MEEVGHSVKKMTQFILFIPDRLWKKSFRRALIGRNSACCTVGQSEPGSGFGRRFWDNLSCERLQRPSRIELEIQEGSGNGVRFILREYRSYCY